MKHRIAMLVLVLAAWALPGCSATRPGSEPQPSSTDVPARSGMSLPTATLTPGEPVAEGSPELAATPAVASPSATHTRPPPTLVRTETPTPPTRTSTPTPSPSPGAPAGPVLPPATAPAAPLPSPTEAEPSATPPPTRPAWDPRGMIAFERRAEGAETHDIYLMFHDGSRLENLTDHPADDGAPTWSPDGRWIAFASTRAGNGNHAIYKIDLRSREVTPLTDGQYDDRVPTWSPDGSRIAFMRTLTTNGHANSEIFVMNADGSHPANVTNYEWGDDFPAWSRDGQWIAFTSERNWGGRDLWLMRPDGSDTRIVLRTDFQDEVYPTWGAEGRIYYTFNPAPKAELLYRIWPDGSGMEPVFPDARRRTMASWSPDGGCFVYYGYEGGEDKEVWKWCAGFDTPVNLTDNDGISDEFCAWSPVP